MSPFLRSLSVVFSFLLSFVALTTVGFAQQCILKSEQLPDAPELRGFRLGQTFDQVEGIVPQIKFGRADEIGVTKTSISPLYDQKFDQAKFADIRTISFDFLDGKLTTLWIGYENSFKWQTVDEFIQGINKALNLPRSWSPRRNGQQLHCDGLTIFVSLVAGSPSIRLSDDAADSTIALRREEVAAAAEARVVGDKTTNLYYPADCESAEKIAPLNRIVFTNKEEAERAGYKLAKVCE